MNPLDFLQSWYRAQTNGEWEHVRGVTIETLDNPGWMVRIDLADTPLENQAMAEIREERAPDDWLICFIENGQFRGQGDTFKLEAILAVFEKWASATVGPRSS